MSCDVTDVVHQRASSPAGSAGWSSTAVRKETVDIGAACVQTDVIQGVEPKVALFVEAEGRTEIAVRADGAGGVL